MISNSTHKKSKIDKNKKMDELLKSIYDMRGGIVIVSSGHDFGKQLEGFGGIAALLRFRIAAPE